MAAKMETIFLLHPFASRENIKHVNLFAVVLDLLTLVSLGFKRLTRMEFYNNFNKRKLPFVTIFLLSVDIVLVIALGINSEGWTKITQGDIIVIAVVSVFTFCIMLANIVCLISQWRSSRKQRELVRVVEAPIDFNCAICLDENRKDTVQIKCGHVFHDDCICECLKRNSNDKKCPICRQEMEPFKKKHWFPSLNRKILMSLNQHKNKDDMTGLISVV